MHSRVLFFLLSCSTLLFLAIFFLPHLFFTFQSKCGISQLRNTQHRHRNPSILPPYSQHLKDFPYIIKASKSACSPYVKDGSPFILVFVESRLTNVLQRNFFRNSWAKVKQVGGGSVKWIFVLGRTASKIDQQNLEKESVKFGDIVQRDFNEHYRNLTLSTLTGFHWSLEFCPETQFIFKSDDDVVINVEVLSDLLMRMPFRLARNLYVGFLSQNSSRPIRDPGHKWFLNQTLYSSDSFPLYNMGVGYLFSNQALRYTLAACDNLQLLPIEDVFMGLCAREANIKPVDHRAFQVELDIDEDYDNFCIYSKFVTIHGARMAEKKKMWKYLRLDLPLHLRKSIDCSDELFDYYNNN